jgi:hypothetical protein
MLFATAGVMATKHMVANAGGGTTRITAADGRIVATIVVNNVDGTTRHGSLLVFLSPSLIKI